MEEPSCLAESLQEFIKKINTIEQIKSKSGFLFKLFKFSQPKNLFFFLFSSFCFLCSYYPQEPLYFSNQNTYFLHGLASAGYGNLNKDWLAGTVDPFPIFSFFIKYLYMAGGITIFLIIFWLILLTYFWILFAIIVYILEIKKYYSRFVVSLIIVFLHSSVLHKTYFYTNSISVKSIGSFCVDGLAGQYVMGPCLQPSVLGVLILISIYLFMKGKKKLAIFFLVLCVYFHSSYLLVSILVLSGFITYQIILENKYDAFKNILVYILLISPIFYLYYPFLQDSSIDRINALHILYNFRLPHHANIRDWIDTESILKIFVVILAIIIINKKKNVYIILSPVIIGVVLSLIQYFTGDELLGIIFPWRISVILLPISSLIVFIFLIIRLKYLVEDESIPYLMPPVLALMLLLAFAGGKENYYTFINKKSYSQLELYRYAISTRGGNDIYFIPIELENFRLETGIPIFVDLKSHPYKSSEVIEWYKRIRLAESIINPDSTINFNKLSELNKNYKITHFVFEKSKIKIKVEPITLNLIETEKYLIIKE